MEKSISAVTESEMISQHLCANKFYHNRDSNSEKCAKGSKSDSCDKKQAPLGPDIQSAHRHSTPSTTYACSKLVKVSL